MLLRPFGAVPLSLARLFWPTVTGIGNRRFLVCTLTRIDWSYAENVDVNQVWAQAGRSTNTLRSRCVISAVPTVPICPNLMYKATKKREQCAGV